jgi:hypothetical protein
VFRRPIETTAFTTGKEWRCIRRNSATETRYLGDNSRSPQTAFEEIGRRAAFSRTPGLLDQNNFRLVRDSAGSYGRILQGPLTSSNARQPTDWGASGVSAGFGLPGWSLKTSLITCIMHLRPSFSKLISSFASSNNPVNNALLEPESLPNAFLDAVLGQVTAIVRRTASAFFRLRTQRKTGLRSD